MFACRSRFKGYDMMIGWANTVVHVSKNLEARGHPISPQDNLKERVRFALEQFGYLFLFREGCVAVAYKGNELVKFFLAKYWNYTSHGVCAGKSAIYYTEDKMNTVYKTGIFVILSNQNLFT